MKVDEPEDQDLGRGQDPLPHQEGFSTGRRRFGRGWSIAIAVALVTAGLIVKTC